MGIPVARPSDGNSLDTPSPFQKFLIWWDEKKKQGIHLNSGTIKAREKMNDLPKPYFTMKISLFHWAN